MKWLRIISVYISLVLMASCASAPVAVDIPEPNVTVICRNDTNKRKIVHIYNWSNNNANVMAADVLAGKQFTFTKFNYGDVYDIKWSRTLPDYKTIHWYSFKVNAGKVHFLTTPSRTDAKAGDSHADWEFSIND